MENTEIVGKTDAGCSRQPAKEEVAQTSLPLSALQCLLAVVSVSRDCLLPFHASGRCVKEGEVRVELLPSLCKNERLSILHQKLT